MLLFAMALRNARRNVVRSTLTALTVALGTAILCAALSWVNGIFGSLTAAAANSAGHARVVQPEYARKEVLLPLYANLPETDALSAELLAMPGVQQVIPRIVSGATMTRGASIGEVYGAVIGAPPAYLDRLELADAVQSGALPGPDSPPGVLLGASLAARLGASVGDEVVLLGLTQDGSLSPMAGPVLAIVSQGNALIDQAAFISLEKARYMADIPDGATELLVYGADRDDADALAAALSAQPSLTGLTVQSWSGRPPWDSIIAISNVISGILASIIVGVTALGVWNTMMMSVMERTREIGVLRAMGMTRLGTVGLFMVEGLGIATLGGLAGVALGGGIGLWLEANGINLGATVSQNMSAAVPFRSTMYGDMSWGVALQSLALALTMALVGTTIPAWRAASVPPVDALRHH